MSKLLDLTGKKFGRLLALRRVSPSGVRSVWECQCDCGSLTRVLSDSLQMGRTKSCCCLRNEGPKGPNAHGTKPTGVAARNSMYHSLKFSALKRGHSWKLTKEVFDNITTQSCFYCGIEPRQIFKQTGCNGTYVYNGIDRVDNTRGYESDNVVPCCGQCNRAKRDLTKDAFLDWADRLSKCQKTKIDPIESVCQAR